tara:strand:- start:1919 stop:2293 length:375 start_codon:yes stop_codon:yes gene_type:complete
MLDLSVEASRVELKKHPELRGYVRSAMSSSLLDPSLHDTACRVACYLGLTGFPDRCLYGDIHNPLGQPGITFEQSVDIAFNELREYKVLPNVGFVGNIRQRCDWQSFINHLVWLILYSDGERSP